MRTGFEGSEEYIGETDDLPATFEGETSLSGTGLRQPIRVLVANRTAIESELLADSIGKKRRFVAVGWGVRYADIDALALRGNPDVLLITPRLDDQPSAGFDVLADFRISYPTVKTVVLMESRSTEFVVQSFRLGARGVFSMDLPLKLLTKCVTRVYEGQIWATNEQFGFVMEALAFARNVHPCRNGSPDKLTAREVEVVNSVAAGLADESIAQRLKPGRQSSKNHTAKTSHKSGASGFEGFLPRQKSSITSSRDWKKEPGDGRVA